MRNLAVHNMDSLLELLQSFCKGYTKAAEITSACNDYLFENDDKDLMLFFDGYDEFPVELSKRQLNCWDHRTSSAT